MLRRASDLTARARERIRAAREHDPHAWPERRPCWCRRRHPGRGRARRGARTGRRADVRRRPAEDDAGRDARARRWAVPNPARRTSTAPSARRGQRPAGPGGRRRHRAGTQPRRPARARPRPRARRARVPNGLRMAAAWSWRFIVVLAGFYVLLYAAGLRRRRRRPGDRRAAARRAAAARRGRPVRRGWPRVAGRVRRCCSSAWAWSPGSSRWSSSGSPPASTTSPTRSARASGRCRTSSSARSRSPSGQLEDAVDAVPADARRQPGHARLRRADDRRHRRRGASPASSWPCSRSSSSSRTAGRSGCGWSACSPATPAPTSTRRPAGRGAR